MVNLSTTYLGLTLKNPLIVGACGLTNSVESIKELADNGASAVVLKSLFEEQILMNSSKADDQIDSDYPESFDYITSYTKQHEVDAYLTLIEETKKTVDIPIIASINCTTNSEWVNFAKRIQEAGADAIELNISLLPTDASKDSAANEAIYFSIISTISKHISIPLSVKIGFYSSGLAHLIQQIAWTNQVKGIVLFSRYYKPDFNIENLTLTAAPVFSTPSDIYFPLRWIGIMSPKVEVDLSASSGVHDAEGVIKLVLAGAQTVQVVSCLYQKGPAYLQLLLAGLTSWMEKKGYTTLTDFRGKLSQEHVANQVSFERVQFMKYFAGIE